MAQHPMRDVVLNNLYTSEDALYPDQVMSLPRSYMHCSITVYRTTTLTTPVEGARPRPSTPPIYSPSCSSSHR